MPKVYKEIIIEVAEKSDIANRRIIACISSEAIDRDGEIVLADAMKNAMPGFMKNPVVIVYHQHRLGDGTPVVIGKVVRWWQEKDKTLVEIEFADTEKGREYFSLYAGKYQQAFSIGFNSAKRETRIVDGKSVPVHTEIELYELSVVAVPANPEALTKSTQEQFAKSLAAIEKSIADRFVAMEKNILESIENLQLKIEDLLINDPNGLGEFSLGKGSIPPVEEKDKTGQLLNAIANTLKENHNV